MAHAEDADSQVWTQFTFNAKFPTGLRLFAEVQPRLGNNYRNFTQLVARPMIGYQVNRRMSVWMGYAWAPTFQPEFNGENRLFQQLLFEDRFPGLDMNNRTRLEERSIEGSGGTEVRLRHMVRLYKPLGTKKLWGIAVYDELFWNLNSTPRGPEAGFDQNRVYLGGAYNISKHTRVELGYLASFINPPRHRPDRRFDVLMLTMNYNL